MSKELEVWALVKKYLEKAHHKFIKEDIPLKTIEGMSIDIIENALKEHEQHKAIAEELGIDLVTLFKAQTQGFYIKFINRIEKVRLSDFKFNIPKKEVHRIVSSNHYYFKDYGKTWALTKEELL